MTVASLKEQIIRQLDHLTPIQQAQLLEVARKLQQSTLPEGVPGEVLIANMDRFRFPPGAVDEMMQAIEENCENVDLDGWE